MCIYIYIHTFILSNATRLTHVFFKSDKYLIEAKYGDP